ncbi:MAG TPA: hypothetical protein VFB42_08225 [Gaiellaceae bacterium]|nr:hypothetical protein [Gaiellaceae bacterium]
MRASPVLLGLLLAASGCGGGGGGARPAARPHVSQAAEMKAIVRAWSRRLNAGDNAGEAALFALPVTMIQGPYAYRLVTPRQVAEWHAALPCSGEVVSIAVRGRVATAVFRLGDRKTSRCDAPGTLAAARFTIVHGRITLWQQVPPPSTGPVA